MRRTRWNENKLKAKVIELGRQAQPSWVWLPFQDRFKSGIPDLWVTGNNVTSIWEFKYADPDFESPGIQELTMKRLSAQCHRAYYIIFDARDPDRTSTRIIPPMGIKEWDKYPFLWASRGFDFNGVVETIAMTHQVEIFR